MLERARTECCGTPLFSEQLLRVNLFTAMLSTHRKALDVVLVSHICDNYIVLCSAAPLPCVGGIEVNPTMLFIAAVATCK